MSFFQALGVIPGKVVETEGKLYVKVRGKEYPLFSDPKRKQALRSQAKKTPDLRLLVYPRVIHFPGKDKEHVIGFQVVGFEAGQFKFQADLKDFEFVLAGLWQYIPVCKYPCVSVFRNFSEERLQDVKQMEEKEKLKFLKAIHVPMIWKDGMKPFRYRKDQPSEPASFVRVKAAFIPGRDVFGFQSIVEPPVQEVPRYLKKPKQKKQATPKKVAPKKVLGVA